MLLQEIAGSVRTQGFIPADPVSHAEGPLIGQLLCLHRSPVEGPCQDGEGAVPAFRGFLTEVLGKFQKLPEGGPGHDVHDPGIVGGPLLPVAVGAVPLQAVGQVAAGYDHGSSVQGLRRFSDALSQAVVGRQGEPRQTDSDKTVFRPILVHEIQGNHGAVVQLPLPLPQGTGLYAADSGFRSQAFRERRVIGDLHARLGRPELPEVPPGVPPRRDMEIVGVHGLMGGEEHDGLRLQPPDFFRHAFV